MKIPTSSSLILATLAISSSSASLAAPTGEINTGTGSSLHRASQAMDNEDRADGNMMERDSGDPLLEARDGPVLSDILSSLPVVGPLLKPLLLNECADPNNPNSQPPQNDPVAVKRLQDAVGTVSSALSGLLPTGAPIAGLPVPIPSGLIGALPIIGAQAIDGPDPTNQEGSLNSDAGAAHPATPSLDAPAPSNSGDPSGAPPPDAAPSDATAMGDATPSDGGSFLISPTTTIANAEEATPMPQDPDYLSAGSGSATPTSPGVPSGPPNTPVPVSSAPASG